MAGDKPASDTDQLVDSDLSPDQAEAALAAPKTGSPSPKPAKASKSVLTPGKAGQRPPPRPKPAPPPADFDFEAQDLQPFERLPPDPVKVGSAWFVIEDIGDTALIAEASGDPSKANLIRFILAHVKKPVLDEERLRGWKSGALIMLFQTVMDRLGLNEDFFGDAVSSLTSEESPPGPTGSTP